MEDPFRNWDEEDMLDIDQDVSLCPKCLVALPSEKNWTRCPECGAGLNFAFPESLDDDTCSRCGQSLKPHWTHCPACGRELFRA
jgi:predicted amidophosphoribosyltransferase